MYLLDSQAAMSRGGASCQLIQTICTISRPSIWLFPHIMYFVFGWSHFFMCWFLMVSLVWFFAIFKLKVRKYVQYQIVLQQNPQIQALNTIQYLYWPCSPGVHLGTSSPSTCRTWTSRSEPAQLLIYYDQIYDTVNRLRSFLSFGHSVIQSSWHPVILSSCHHIIISLGHHVIWSLGHHSLGFNIYATDWLTN